MKDIRILVLVGWGCLAALHLHAQKKVPQSYQFQAPASEEAKLQEITQISYANTNSMRLFFENVQLGENSYLLLEGNDGAKQKMNAQALQNWNNSSAYFNGQNVKVSVYQATGEEVALQLKEIGVDQEIKTHVKHQKVSESNASLPNPPSNSVDTEEMPWAAAVGRFTNGSDVLGTGWIAPNGAIVTSRDVAQNVINNGFDVIEFNVPLSDPDASVNHPDPEDQYPVVPDHFYFTNETLANFTFKHSVGGEEIRIISWAILEALPNGTGLRPGERQQQYFQIVTNPGSFVSGSESFEVDLLHYGDYPEDTYVYLAGAPYRTLRKVTTNLFSQKEFVVSKHRHPSGYFGGSDLDREELLIYTLMDKNDIFPSASASGAPITYHQSNVAIGVHDLAIPENSEMIYTGAIGFANGYLRNSLNDYFTSNVVYVDAYGLYGNNSTGEIHKPYLQVEEGADNAPENATVFIAKGSYNESLTISTPMTLKAPVGVVKIGTSEGSNARSIQPSLSAELFMNDGESLLEEWEDESVKTISLQSFPNPFTHQTELHYTLTDDSPVVVKVYDMMGQEVQTLVEEEQLKGAHHLQWDGHNQQGKTMPPGIYIMQLNTGGETSSVRVMKQ